MIPDSQSFLFTLVNPSGNEPIKINPNQSAAIRCRNDSGPVFGSSIAIVCDLTVWYQKNGSGLGLGHGFTRPEYVNGNTYFTGRSPFEVTELEVFKVNH